MYLKFKSFKLYFSLIFILSLKPNFLTSSVIVDRHRLNNNLTQSDEFISSLHNQSSSIDSSSSSFLSDLSSSSSSSNLTNLQATLNESANQSKNLTHHSSHQKNSNFIANQKKLIENLVKELPEDVVKSEKNGTAGDEKPSTNNILTEEMINDYKINNSYEFKNIELKSEFKTSTQANESSTGNDSLVTSHEPMARNSKSNAENADLNNANIINQTRIDELIKKSESESIFDLYVSEQMDCMFVRSEEGVYSFYSNKNHTEVCALYMIAEPNNLVEFEFLDFNVSCGEYNDAYPKNNKSLISIVDGWELKGEFFPGIQDHHLDKNKRYKEICLNNEMDRATISQKFIVSQNVGLVQFRVLNRYEGFKVRVRFIENPKPCNVVLGKFQGIHTLKNYGQPINCSASILYPESITILTNSIGTKPLMIEGEKIGLDKKPPNYCAYQLAKNQTTRPEDDRRNEKLENNNTIQTADNDCSDKIENGIIHDYIELKGGSGLDTDLMLIADKMCFVKELKDKKREINCGNTAVRLVSSGLYDNSVTFTYDFLQTPHSDAFKCPQMSSYMGR